MVRVDFLEEKASDNILRLHENNTISPLLKSVFAQTVPCRYHRPWHASLYCYIDVDFTYSLRAIQLKEHNIAARNHVAKDGGRSC